MAKEPEINFVRVERDCQYNANLKRKGEPSRNLIRDFNVIIDGEHRAIFKRAYTRKGYDLSDADHQFIKEKDSHRSAFKVDSQADFLGVAKHFLDKGLIPTLEQMAAARAAREAAKAKRAAEQKEQDRIYHIQQAGLELHAALVLMISDYRSDGCPDPTCGVCKRSNAAMAAAKAALAKAERKTENNR